MNTDVAFLQLEAVLAQLHGALEQDVGEAAFGQDEDGHSSGATLSGHAAGSAADPGSSPSGDMTFTQVSLLWLQQGQAYRTRSPAMVCYMV